MAQDTDRIYDKTQLHIETATDRGIMHRDYAAHLFRWSAVFRHLVSAHRYKNARILDIGCGQDWPLAKTLYSNKLSGPHYVGVDLNSLEPPDILIKAVTGEKLRIDYFERTDASVLTKEDLPYDNNELPTLIVALEVFEHMHPGILHRLMKTIRSFMAPGTACFFSTPCYNGSAAGNHINEMSYNTMGALIEHNGMTIVNKYGTFASQRDAFPAIEKKYGSETVRYLEDLKQFYDSNVISILCAPMVPEVSRNVLWTVYSGTASLPQFQPLAEVLKTEENQHPHIEALITGELPQGAFV